MGLLLLIELFITGTLVFLSAVIIYKAPIWRNLVIATAVSATIFVATLAIWIYQGGKVSLNYTQIVGLFLYLSGIARFARNQYLSYKRTQAALVA